MQVLKKHYDPVNVRLADAPQQKKQAAPSTKRPPPPQDDEYKSEKLENRLAEFTLLSSSSKDANKSLSVSDEVTPAISTVSPAEDSTAPDSENVTRKNKTKSKSGKGKKSGRSSRARNLKSKRNGKKKATGRPKNPPKAKSHPRAKATLLGLSTLRRDGDVTVNVMSAHTTVKAKFFVGPLMLKVEKEFGRGVKKELRSATATTAEMMGKINLRVMHGGQATLHSIRVLQPKQNPPKAKSHPRAKATLLGLSTLRRDGDVTVNVMSAHTTVKAKFFVGPLMLKVEKEIGLVI
ncbi:uncharacterized protein LOC103515776 [Diaphorina citri]|uniref:Uncharacterized protein LOC103515776 n=1 Tax=Diaphorina citri TaxID=121845 RepID=A0A3Q0J6T2_DIACI|nr:uncharacterized protein LOC103515776 [Diaphorina citri]